jgi:hypothetical protein
MQTGEAFDVERSCAANGVALASTKATRKRHKVKDRLEHAMREERPAGCVAAAV